MTEETLKTYKNVPVAVVADMLGISQAALRIGLQRGLSMRECPPSGWARPLLRRLSI